MSEIENRDESLYGNRIRIEGDTFSILPPNDGDA